MIGYTANEFAMARNFNRRHNDLVDEAQGIIDRQARELRTARAEIKRLSDALVLERGARRAAQLDARQH